MEHIKDEDIKIMVSQFYELKVLFYFLKFLFLERYWTKNQTILNNTLGDLSCIINGFKPAPLVKNSVLKYLRLQNFCFDYYFLILFLGYFYLQNSKYCPYKIVFRSKTSLLRWF